MKVSILIPTYNRAELLRGAIVSVLKQDFKDFQLVIMDDCSTDKTTEVVESFSDSRIKYVRATENIGSNGDVAIYRKFLSEHCEGEFFAFLCDDDYWVADDFLSCLVEIVTNYPSVVLAIGGVAQKFPTPVDLFQPNEKYIKYRHAAEKDEVFAGNLFPAGFLPSMEFLELFAADPKNRNIVCGGMLFKTEEFRKSNVLTADLGWQAGYAFICGMIVNGGDAYYIDEPCVVNRVEIGSASFRGTQVKHFEQCLCSIDAAFSGAKGNARLESLRQKMAKSVFRAYLCNKISHKLGGFVANPLGDISHVLTPPILSEEFLNLLESHNILVTDSNREIIAAADSPADELRKYGWPKIMGMSS